MLDIIEKKVGKATGKQKTKKQIILTHTSRDAREYLASLINRYNGRYTKIPNYLITKDGKIIQLLSDIQYSEYFNQIDYNRNSIIISFENLGWLEKVQLKTHYNNWISNIYNGVPYERKWRDYFLWDPYTDVQLKTASELCINLTKKHKIELKSIGHNTRVERPDKFGGIITRANFDSKYTDVSPAFNFETFNKYLRNE
jgi:N-acetyl-anhydromuramyl-L-alanine amidase AmpD